MKNTIENNILLAEFLGWKTDSKGKYITPFGEMDESGYLRYDYEKSNLQFDCDWNWLMTVVDKIESLENVFGFYIIFDKYTKQTKVEIYPYNNSFIKMQVYKQSKLEATYNACIEFVKWYNDNK